MRCSNCNEEVKIEYGVIITGCNCNAAIVAELEADLEGNGNVERL